MKNYYLLFVLSVFTLPLFAQKTTDTIQSVKLNEKRAFTVSLPASYGSEKNRTYPLFQVTGDLFMPEIIGDDIIAFKSNGDFYKVFWKGRIYDL